MITLIRKGLRAVIRWALSVEDTPHDPSELDRIASHEG